MQQGGQSKSSSGAYGFDPTGLERAAKAARELDGSSHAKDAFQISIKQEETKKAEFETKKKEIEMQIVQVEQAEKRKTLQQEFEMSKAKAEYEDQLTKKRYQQQLQDHAKMQEQNRMKDEQSVLKQEQMKRQTIEYEQKLRRENDQFFLQQKEALKIQRMRDTKEIRHEDIRLKENERRKTLQELWSMNLTNVGKGLHSYLTDFHNLATLSAGLTLTFFGFQFARSSARVVTRLVESRIGKPALVRETSRPTTLGQYLAVPIRKLQKKKSDVLQGIIIDENLEKNLRTISHAILNKKKHFAPYRNLLLYGPPGTGKTLFAKSLALNSGMEFAILTGGDIGPLGREGVHELHKLFDWSRTSRKGVLLFVDEADAFLRKRASDEIISEHMRNAINAFLYRTGTESHDFMLVLASNAPEQLDRAIHDRLDEMVFFDRPGEQQRLQMLYHYMLKYISIHRSFLDRLKEFWRNPRGFFQKTEIGMKDVDAVHIESAAKKTEGFSGREIFKLVVAWHDAAFSKQNAVLTPEIMDEVLLNHIEQHQQRRMWEKFKIYNQQPISQILNTVKNVEKEEKLGEAN